MHTISIGKSNYTDECNYLLRDVYKRLILLIVFFQLKNFSLIFSKFHFLIFLIDSQIHFELGGDIKITFPLTTSGIAARFEVIKFFHMAQASECTEPNHSAKEGAIITSAHATKILRSFLENHLKIWILFSAFNCFDMELILSTMYSLLLDGIILKSNFELGFSFKI